jgi:hypothetical protein
VSSYLTSGAGGSGLTNTCGPSGWGAEYAIDIWQAWLDGAWTSSVAFNVYADNFTSGTGYTTVGYNNDGSISPGHVCKSFAVGLPQPSCATALVATYTFYEDGTFTVA